MLWFTFELHCMGPVSFTPFESAFKGIAVHRMFERALAKQSPSLIARLESTNGNGGARYALFPPLDRRAAYVTGERVPFSVVLFGTESGYWREVLAALLEPGALELGDGRSPLLVVRIDALNPHRIRQRVYDRHHQAALRCAPHPIDIMVRSGPSAGVAALRLLTPIAIPNDACAKAADDPPISLRRWIGALRKRVSDLEPEIAARFEFAGHAWQAIERGLRSVSVLRNDTRPVAHSYLPTTHSRPIQLRGRLGAIEYAGEIASPVLRLLEIGEWLGIGQRTTLGQGWYRLI